MEFTREALEREIGACASARKEKGQLKELMEELVEAMVESATDELGSGYPEWGWRWDDTLEVTTQQSRDPSRARNGGEYFGYTFFEIRPDGVEVWEGSSCELVSRAEEKARSTRGYPISLSKEGLERMAHLAEARALQRVVPDEALDPKVAFAIKAAMMLISKEIGFKEFKEAVRASQL